MKTMLLLITAAMAAAGCQSSGGGVTLNNTVTACGSGDCTGSNNSANNNTTNQGQGLPNGEVVEPGSGLRFTVDGVEIEYPIKGPVPEPVRPDSLEDFFIEPSLDRKCRERKPDETVHMVLWMYEPVPPNPPPADWISELEYERRSNEILKRTGIAQDRPSLFPPFEPYRITDGVNTWEVEVTIPREIFMYVRLPVGACRLFVQRLESARDLAEVVYDGEIVEKPSLDSEPPHVDYNQLVPQTLREALKSLSVIPMLDEPISSNMPMVSEGETRFFSPDVLRGKGIRIGIPESCMDDPSIGGMANGNLDGFSGDWVVRARSLCPNGHVRSMMSLLRNSGTIPSELSNAPMHPGAAPAADISISGPDICDKLAYLAGQPWPPLYYFQNRMNYFKGVTFSSYNPIDPKKLKDPKDIADFGMFDCNNPNRLAIIPSHPVDIISLSSSGYVTGVMPGDPAEGSKFLARAIDMFISQNGITVVATTDNGDGRVATPLRNGMVVGAAVKVQPAEGESYGVSIYNNHGDPFLVSGIRTGNPNHDSDPVRQLYMSWEVPNLIAPGWTEHLVGQRETRPGVKQIFARKGFGASVSTAITAGLVARLMAIQKSESVDASYKLYEDSTIVRAILYASAAGGDSFPPMDYPQDQRMIRPYTHFQNNPATTYSRQDGDTGFGFPDAFDAYQILASGARVPSGKLKKADGNIVEFFAHESKGPNGYTPAGAFMESNLLKQEFEYLTAAVQPPPSAPSDIGILKYKWSIRVDRLDGLIVALSWDVDPVCDNSDKKCFRHMSEDYDLLVVCKNAVGMETGDAGEKTPKLRVTPTRAFDERKSRFWHFSSSIWDTNEIVKIQDVGDADVCEVYVWSNNRGNPLRELSLKNVRKSGYPGFTLAWKGVDSKGRSRDIQETIRLRTSTAQPAP